MAEDREQRRLAAILAADVVGYSRLMGKDEAGTLAQLRTLRRELFDPMVERHGGRIVTTSGDGVLIEFPSAVRAVEHAVELQRALGRRNDDVPPDRRIELRIGINVGDVIVEAGDVFGDGVNVAARLEGLAEPGGICISDDVYRQVRGRVDAAFVDQGPTALKNIAEPVRVYRVSPGDAPADAPAATAARVPSVAVLPFDNLSGDADQEYFSDGIAEDVISALSRIRGLFVVARNSSFSYKGQAPDVRKVSAELGARYVLEGSVRKAGDRVRISAQLIDGETGNHLWAERYDRRLDDIFDVQDDITATVVGALQPELGKAERERARAKRSEDLDAWDAYQRGMWHTYRRTKDDLAAAMGLFRRSRALDPDFAPAHWGAAVAIFYSVIWGRAESRSELLDEGLRLARRGLDLDPDDSMAHTAMAYIRFARREHGDAVSACQRAMELDPNNYLAPRFLGFALTASGRAAEALHFLHQSVRLSPHDPLVSGTLGWIATAYMFVGDLEQAADWARRALRAVNAPQIWTMTASLSIFGHLGLAPEADRARAELLRIEPDITCAFVKANIPIVDPESLDLYVDGLRKAGLPG